MVHGRISTRLPDFEYRGGVYHVVICTSDRESFLGEIINHEMCCNELGLYVEKCLQTVPYHLSYAHVPFFQVMPNHVHALVRIDTNLFSRPIGATGVACCAPTGPHHSVEIANLQGADVSKYDPPSSVASPCGREPKACCAPTNP